MLVLLSGTVSIYKLRVQNLKVRGRNLKKQVNRQTKELISRTQELESLNSVAIAVSQSYDLDQVLSNSFEITLKVMGVHAGGIYLLQEDSGVLTIVEHKGLDAQIVADIDNLKLGEGLSGLVAQTGKPLVVPDLSMDPRAENSTFKKSGFFTLAISPLVSRKKVFGTLFILTNDLRDFSESEMRLISSIGGQIGVAVENTLLHKQARKGAVLEERQRLARELHDSVTQSLHSSTLMAEAGQRLAGAGDLERTQHYLVRLGSICQQSLKEMRLLVYELRPLALKEVGLVEALQQRLDAVERRAGIDARLVICGDNKQSLGKIELPTEVEEELFRIAQEALNNVMKHAGATSITVTIRVENELAGQQVVLEVIDNGQGFKRDTKRDKGGLGLVGMGERADKIGGRLTIDSVPGEGTTVNIVFNGEDQK